MQQHLRNLLTGQRLINPLAELQPPHGHQRQHQVPRLQTLLSLTNRNSPVRAIESPTRLLHLVNQRLNLHLLLELNIADLVLSVKKIGTMENLRRKADLLGGLVLPLSLKRNQRMRARGKRRRKEMTPNPLSLQLSS